MGKWNWKVNKGYWVVFGIIFKGINKKSESVNCEGSCIRKE